MLMLTYGVVMAVTLVCDPRPSHATLDRGAGRLDTDLQPSTVATTTESRDGRVLDPDTAHTRPPACPGPR
jgi:hypothetical protein